MPPFARIYPRIRARFSLNFHKSAAGLAPSFPLKCNKKVTKNDTKSTNGRHNTDDTPTNYFLYLCGRLGMCPFPEAGGYQPVKYNYHG